MHIQQTGNLPYGNRETRNSTLNNATNQSASLDEPPRGMNLAEIYRNWRINEYYTFN